MKKIIFSILILVLFISGCVGVEQPKTETPTTQEKVITKEEAEQIVINHFKIAGTPLGRVEGVYLRGDNYMVDVYAGGDAGTTVVNAKDGRIETEWIER